MGFLGTARAHLPRVAYPVAYEMDHLVTVDCAHLAKGEVIRRLLATSAALGRPKPLVVTPEVLLEPRERVAL